MLELSPDRHVLERAAATHAEMRAHGRDTCTARLEHLHQVRLVSPPAAPLSEYDLLPDQRPADAQLAAVHIDHAGSARIERLDPGDQGRLRRSLAGPVREGRRVPPAQRARLSDQAERNSATCARSSPVSASRSASHSRS